MSFFAEILLAILSILAALPLRVLAVDLTVTIPSGSSFNGIANGSVNQWLGIPFADKPPRFGPPPDPPIVNNFEAIYQPPGCLEANPGGPLGPGSGPGPNLTAPQQDEDCLKLNIYAPSCAAPGSLPVMFFLYGGAFSLGWIDPVGFNGTSFAENQNIIIVTANYRLNVFGFPMTTELDKPFRNPGLLDQAKALQWVQDNIASFGGNPRMVTIFGQSAGAASVDELILSHSGSGLFRAAIMESGSWVLVDAGIVLNQNLTSPNSTWNTLGARLRCNDATKLDCMRNQSAQGIQSALQTSPILQFLPVYDGGATVVQNPSANQTKLPIMIGSNSQEALSFPNWTNSIPADFQGLLQQVLTEYSNSTDRNVTFLTDALFNCPAANIARTTAQLGGPVYRYRYDAYFTDITWSNPPGVAHGTEIPIVWGNLNLSMATQDEMTLSDTMQTAWANFAKDPTSPPLPCWRPVINGTGIELAVFTNCGMYSTSFSAFDSGCQRQLEIEYQNITLPFSLDELYGLIPSVLISSAYYQQ